MSSEHHTGQQPKQNSEDSWQAKGAERPRQEPDRTEADAKAEQASRSVMHPESYDPEWRYYHGAWGG